MANGLFNLKQVMQAVQQGGWPAQKPPAVEYLVVAGGGGGSYDVNDGGGGGGGGGLLTGIDPVPNGQTLLVTVGAGGATGNGSNDSGTAGSTGSSSVFGSLTSTGGGGGGTTRTGAGAKSGGSGGGAPSYTGLPSGQGTFRQGFSGGLGLTSGANDSTGGGGGGAGTVGLNGIPSSAGIGGAGIASVISGTVTAYAGGGGGGSWTTNAAKGAASGGAGGGGAGGAVASSGSSTAAVAGTANTGGGGGSASRWSGGVTAAGAAGGSGIVIVSYPDVYAAASATTGSPTVSTSGSGSIYFPDAGGSGGTSAPGYIRYAGTSALAVGATGTYEFWVYPTRFSTNHHVIDQSANSGIQIYYDSSGNLSAGATSGGASAAVSASPLSLNTWTHVAVIFNSGTITIYFNGTGKTLTGTTVGYNMTSTATVSISGYQGIAGQYGVIGYLANVRIVKGVAVYTGNFTSPTAPLQATQPAGTNISAITGTSTSLLLNGVSGAFLADSSTNSYTASSVSTSTAAPTWNQLSPFTGTGYKNRVYTWTSSGSITF